MDAHQNVLAGVSQVGGHHLDALCVNVVGASNVVFSLNVGELIGQALAVKVLFSIGSLVKNDFVWNLDVLVAALFATGWVVVRHVALVNAVLVVGFNHTLH